MTALSATTHDLADSLIDFVREQLEALASYCGPNLALPASFAACAVAPDATADLVFTLGHLHRCGQHEIAGVPVPDAIRHNIVGINGPGTDTFASYRVSETLAHWGSFATNELLRDCSFVERQNVAAACDSSYWVPLLDSGLVPRNYRVVLARCELARRQLGLPEDLDDRDARDARIEDLIGRSYALLDHDPVGFIDDSTHGVGRYDIYSIDVWLFAEPVARACGDRLGELWQRGAEAAVNTVDHLASPTGSAITWGRSSGVLSDALTIEIAALALRLVDVGADTDAGTPGVARAVADRALRRATAVLNDFERWFERGVITAHQHRSQDDYRGPHRRLQLTLDILGKLAHTAAEIKAIPDRSIDDIPPRRPNGVTLFCASAATTPAGRKPAGAWVHDEATVSCVVPFVGGTRSDYLPAPREPGTFEVPVDSDLITWNPALRFGTTQYTLGGTPDSLAPTATGVEATWSSLPVSGAFDPDIDEPRIDVTAHASWTRSGATLEVVTDLHLETLRLPDAVTITIPQSARPLHVAIEHLNGDDPNQPWAQAPLRTISTAGIKEWRSFWNELPLVHEAELPPARRMRVRLRVRPKLRISSSAHGHPYDDSLYEPLDPLVERLATVVGPLGIEGTNGAADLFHLHWPEWLLLADIREHRNAIVTLRKAQIPIVWTAHNLTPHAKDPETFDAIYQLWCDAADAIIHHSAYGKDRFNKRYVVPDGTLQVVIAHGHFGNLYPPATPAERRDAEINLGLRPGGPDTNRIRIGLVGAPRIEKRVDEFLTSFSTSGTAAELACWSLTDSAFVPDDPRIVIAEPYRLVSRDEYRRRLAVCDVLALPFGQGGDMLATGTTADAIGAGLPALCSSWPYLTEYMGAAAMPMGDTPESICLALERLSHADIAAHAESARDRQAATSWTTIAQEVFDVAQWVANRATRRS